MKKILLLILGVFIIIIQNGIINYLSIFGITINLILIYMIIVSLYIDELQAGIIGAILGFILDISVGAVFGSNALALFLISYGLGFVKKKVFMRSLITRVNLMLLGSFTYYLITWILAKFIFNEYIISSIIKLLIVTIVNGLVCIILYSLTEKPISKLGKE